MNRQVVVLNACYSQDQAEALAAHVDCVVGVGGSLRGRRPELCDRRVQQPERTNAPGSASPGNG